jgi:hypothetical protein
MKHRADRTPGRGHSGGPTHLRHGAGRGARAASH